MRSFTVGHIWNIPIRINTSLIVFLPILAWLIGSGGQIEVYAEVVSLLTGRGFDVGTLRAGVTPWVIGVLAAVGLFVSVMIHELGHSWVALRYGLRIESITLWILGGIAAISDLPREWDREFWIAVAGPVTSVLVAVVCYAGALAFPTALVVPRFVLGWLAVTNVTLAAFNLLPAFPMDGGRVLRALLARSRPYGSATRIAARIGVVFAILFAVVGALSFQVLLLLLALFIYGAATTESRTVLLYELLAGVTVGDIATRDPGSVTTGTTIEEFAGRMLRDRRTAYLVTDGSGAVVGAVTLAGLQSVPRDERATTTVGEVVRDALRVEASTAAFDALAPLSGSENRVALVEEDGSVVGVLSESDYAHAMTVQREFRSGVTG